ncbi:MAG TPA: SsrA-binding protein [Candidatus Taylorbacteria bacterium]|nr:MAG: SsrA-binding protein [Parcubacteria group bacterium GW2011_GWA2_47_64]KKU96915.1 MAG: SsrA-binding protein [Parcubacteria group bacterium GW2011_GWC2_48_17]HBV01503.1 SsrA-binding protein [Candidatus Taylorbacteria bacterium]
MLIENRKAKFNYEFLEKLDAGIELLGSEVKSLRAKLGSLEGAYVIVRGNEAFMVGAYIPAYQPKNTPKGYDERRNRKLLLTKKEIASLMGAEAKKGLTIVPISVYNRGHKLKVTLAIARGKKKFDKRETIKLRDTERDIRREMHG